MEVVRRTAGGSVDADAPLMEAGVDSLGAVELRTQLQKHTAAALPSTLVFDHPTARELAALAVEMSATAPALLPTAASGPQQPSRPPVQIKCSVIQLPGLDGSMLYVFGDGACPTYAPIRILTATHVYSRASQAL
jgi:acyl carrier protein